MLEVAMFGKFCAHDRAFSGAKLSAHDCAFSGAEGCHRFNPLGLQFLVLISACVIHKEPLFICHVGGQHMKA